MTDPTAQCLAERLKLISKRVYFSLRFAHLRKFEYFQSLSLQFHKRHPI